MRRVVLAALAALVVGLGTASPAAACHFGGLGCSGPPESQPFDPQPFASLSDQRTGAHPDVETGWTQNQHEQLVTKLQLDLHPAFEVHLDAPVRGERLADLEIRAIVSGAQVTLSGRIEDDNDGVEFPSGGVYRWKVTIEGTTGDIVCAAFADENSPDGHFQFRFEACPELVQQADSTDASVLRVTQTTFGRVAAGPFITNPDAAGTYTSSATFTARDDAGTPETPPTVTRTVSVTVTERVPQTVGLSPATATRQAGSTHTVTATVRDQGGEALAGAEVDVEAIAGPHTGPKCLDLTTDAAGTATCTYSESTPGTDTLRATATRAGTSASATATVDWDAPTTLTLAPASATRSIGQTHGVTATLTDDDGQAVAGRAVAFEVTAGPHAGQTGSGTTDGSGRAAFSYAGSATGTDTIHASSAGLTATASVTWEDVPPLVPTSIAMTPETIHNAYMGTQTVTFTALVTDQNGAALPGVDVHFEVISGPNTGDVSGDVVTGSDGKASFSYTGLRENGEGTDTLEAHVAGTTLRDTSTVKWDTDPCDDPDVESDQSFDFTFRPDAEANVNGDGTEQDACVKT